jgi:hypothetical protein
MGAVCLPIAEDFFSTRKRSAPKNTTGGNFFRSGTSDEKITLKHLMILKKSIR